jgi:hypothetical protein
MASKKQIEANRANARKSTGPKTNAGKLISRFNALKRGLSSQKKVTIPGESLDAYIELIRDLMFEYDPQTALQRQLVEQLAFDLLRLRRVAAFEAGVFHVPICEIRAKWGETTESPFDDDPSFPATEECILSGLTFVRAAEGDVLGKLSRHETHLLNSIKKIQKMLEESGCTAKPRN